MINTPKDLIGQAAYSLVGDIPGALVIRGENSYENIEWNVGIVTTPPTKEQVLNKAQELYDGEAMRRLRFHRDRLLAACDWVVVKARETNTNVPAKWKNYRQALRDLPSTASPEISGPYPIISNVVWPTEPT